MYNNHQNTYRQRNRNSAGPAFNKNGFSGRGGKRNQIKKLDFNLFIKKASETNTHQDFSTGSFSDFQIDDKLKRNIQDYGITAPTQIQQQTIPHLLAGKDVIGIANTGTGKTAAFLIPLINKAFLDRNERILIVTPTRELAMQIADELRIFTKGMDLDTVLCIGGTNLDRQVKKLHHNPHFCIGTPGRLKDLIMRGKLKLGLFRNVVLDEVDRMVDIGFINDIRYFISLLPERRQSLFFSATVPDKARDILQNFVKDPVTVSVKQQDTSENVEQDIVRINHSGNKLEKLHELLINEKFQKVLIFGRTKWGIEKLTKALIDRGFVVGAIHGNKKQNQRQRVIDQFKKDQIKILLATDVASRGLDISNVTHVINYDAPETYNDYIHRIGRTGRAGKKGTALTFVD